MSLKSKTVVKTATLVSLCLAMAFVIVPRIKRGVAVGESGAQVWFYDQSEKELYVVPRETVPPHEGIGGTSGDGVRAVVVADDTGCSDTGRQRIAYLETYSPELKRLEQDLLAACKTGSAYAKPIPDSESGFFEKNKLVRRVDEPAWHDLSTSEARRIIAEWRGWKDMKGASLIVCAP